MTRKRAVWTALTLVLVVVVAFIYFRNSSSTSAQNRPQPQSVPIGQRTKTGDCHLAGPLPDSGCTPGAVLEASSEEICRPGYSKSVRNVPESEKAEIYREYGVANRQPGQYEIDHLISLELGGSNDIANLWPEPAAPVPGFHQKDVVENYLHSQVCKGAITLADAQRLIASNWLAVHPNT